jgi:hypothetical protein
LRLVFFCADGAAKVGRVDWRRNFRIAEDSVLNLPSDANGRRRINVARVAAPNTFATVSGFNQT